MCKLPFEPYLFGMSRAGEKSEKERPPDPLQGEEESSLIYYPHFL
jgi:hypothetical protein